MIYPALPRSVLLYLSALESSPKPVQSESAFSARRGVRGWSPRRDLFADGPKVVTGCGSRVFDWGADLRREEKVESGGAGAVAGDVLCGTGARGIGETL